MDKFYGAIGYAQMRETRPGIWQQAITERKYYGDIQKNVRRLENGGSINGDITVNNVISIVADAYARGNFMDMRYVNWQGANWAVTNVEVQFPRLILTLGGVYNGGT
nr:MAG TPA: hypothetical protein [Caudoviricetes sp.]